MDGKTKTQIYKLLCIFKETPGDHKLLSEIWELMEPCAVNWFKKVADNYRKKLYGNVLIMFDFEIMGMGNLLSHTFFATEMYATKYFKRNHTNVPASFHKYYNYYLKKWVKKELQQITLSGRDLVSTDTEAGQKLIRRTSYSQYLGIGADVKKQMRLDSAKHVLDFPEVNSVFSHVSKLSEEVFKHNKKLIEEPYYHPGFEQWPVESGVTKQATIIKRLGYSANEFYYKESRKFTGVTIILNRLKDLLK